MRHLVETIRNRPVVDPRLVVTWKVAAPRRALRRAAVHIGRAALAVAVVRLVPVAVSFKLAHNVLDLN